MGVFVKPMSLEINEEGDEKDRVTRGRRRSSSGGRNSVPYFYKGRLIIAGVLLVGIVIGGVLTHMQGMSEWSNVLLHSFELCLGGFIGLLTGEITSTSS